MAVYTICFMLAEVTIVFMVGDGSNKPPVPFPTFPSGLMPYCLSSFTPLPLCSGSSTSPVRGIMAVPSTQWIQAALLQIPTQGVAGTAGWRCPS